MTSKIWSSSIPQSEMDPEFADSTVDRSVNFDSGTTAMEHAGSCDFTVTREEVNDAMSYKNLILNSSVPSEVPGGEVDFEDASSNVSTFDPAAAMDDPFEAITGNMDDCEFSDETLSNNVNTLTGFNSDVSHVNPVDNPLTGFTNYVSNVDSDTVDESKTDDSNDQSTSADVSCVNPVESVDNLTDFTSGRPKEGVNDPTSFMTDVSSSNPVLYCTVNVDPSTDSTNAKPLKAFDDSTDFTANSTSAFSLEAVDPLTDSANDVSNVGLQQATVVTADVSCIDVDEGIDPLADSAKNVPSVRPQEAIDEIALTADVYKTNPLQTVDLSTDSINDVSYVLPQKAIDDPTDFITNVRPVKSTISTLVDIDVNLDSGFTVDDSTLDAGSSSDVNNDVGSNESSCSKPNSAEPVTDVSIVACTTIDRNSKIDNSVNIHSTQSMVICLDTNDSVSDNMSKDVSAARSVSSTEAERDLNRDERQSVKAKRPPSLHNEPSVMSEPIFNLELHEIDNLTGVGHMKLKDFGKRKAEFDGAEDSESDDSDIIYVERSEEIIVLSDDENDANFSPDSIPKEVVHSIKKTCKVINESDFSSSEHLLTEMSSGIWSLSWDSFSKLFKRLQEEGAKSKRIGKSDAGMPKRRKRRGKGDGVKTPKKKRISCPDFFAPVAIKKEKDPIDENERVLSVVHLDPNRPPEFCEVSRSGRLIKKPRRLRDDVTFFRRTHRKRNREEGGSGLDLSASNEDLSVVDSKEMDEDSDRADSASNLSVTSMREESNDSDSSTIIVVDQESEWTDSKSDISFSAERVKSRKEKEQERRSEISNEYYNLYRIVNAESKFKGSVAKIRILNQAILTVNQLEIRLKSLRDGLKMHRARNKQLKNELKILEKT